MTPDDARSLTTPERRPLKKDTHDFKRTCLDGGKLQLHG